MTDFDPRCPPTSNSLNRLKLESAVLPVPIRGKIGYELLSTRAVHMLIQPHTDDVATFYEQANLEAAWATDIALTLGTRLGGLLFVLIHNDEQIHKANSSKPAGFWDHWSQIETVYLGGGLVRGKVGEIITTQAQTTLQQLANKSDYHVIQVDHPQYLPLLGAARTVRSGNRANILDFGGSFVKRAIAHYAENTLYYLEIHNSLPTDLPADGNAAHLIFEQMVNIIVQSYVNVDASTIPIIVAAYVDAHGQPLLTQSGIYMQLAQLTPDVPAALSQTVSDRLGKAVEINLLHDGTAAALYYTPMEQAAVIMIGTALGSGYPVARHDLALCSVSPTLVVEEVSAGG